MAAFLLLLLLVLAVVSLAFNVRTYKAVKAGGVKTSGRSFLIPRKAVVMEPEKNENIDYEAIVTRAMEGVRFDSEESGEEEVQLSPEDIQKATKAVMAAMQK